MIPKISTWHYKKLILVALTLDSSSLPGRQQQSQSALQKSTKAAAPSTVTNTLIIKQNLEHKSGHRNVQTTTWLTGFHSATLDWQQKVSYGFDFDQ